MPHSFDDTRDVTATGLPRFRDLLGGLSGEEREIAREALFPGETRLTPTEADEDTETSDALRQLLGRDASQVSDEDVFRIMQGLDEPGVLRVAETAEEIPLLTPFPAEFIDERSPLEEQNRFMSEAEDLVRTPPGGFTAESGVQVSGAIRHGPDPFTIENPFADPSLTPEQQREAVQHISRVQESARKIKSERLKTQFKSKWRAVQRVMADPAVPIEQKRQIQFQVQAELREVDQPDLIVDMFDVMSGEDSPEVAQARVKNYLRKDLEAKYGDTALSELASSLVTVDEDGRPDLRAALPFIAMREQQEEGKRKEQRRIEGDRDAMRNQAIQAAHNVPLSKNAPELIAIYDSHRAQYEARYGKLPAGPPRKGNAFDVVAEVSTFFQGGATTPLPSNARPRSTGTGAIVQVRTQRDINMLREDVARRRRAGDINYSVRAQGPDGSLHDIP